MILHQTTGSLNCPFLVLSFSQVIILYIYHLKYEYNYGNRSKFSQHFARFRSISQEAKTVNTEHDMCQVGSFRTGSEKKDIQPNNSLKLNAPDSHTFSSFTPIFFLSVVLKGY